MSDFFRWKDRPEIGEFVLQNYGPHTSPDLSRMIAEKFGTHLQPGAIRDYFRHQRTRAVLEGQGQVVDPVADTTPVHPRRPDQRRPLDLAGAEELYNAAMEEVERKEATRLGQTSLTVDFSDAKEPVGLCFWSDWQLGTSGVMMRQLRKDAEAICNADGLQTFVLGDLIQNLNIRKHPQGLHECVLPDPRDQKTCALWLLHQCKGKIQGMVDGNHEQNSKIAAGLVPTEDWCKELGVPYLWHGALVKFIVGQQEYTLGLRHKFRGESGINTTNAQRIMYEQWNPADVEVLGHLHFNDMQKRRKPGRETVWLRAGTYQIDDEHGQYSGGYRGQWGIPLIILFPDRKSVVPFYGADFYTGLEVLEDQRRRYRLIQDEKTRIERELRR